MDPKEVKSFYEQDGVVIHYARAAANVGLWESERIWLTRTFNTDHNLLEVGCGAGRIAIGLFELGYRNLIATDYSKGMVKAAQAVAHEKRCEIQFAVADACRLKYQSESYDGVVFGFNGLMQIPGQERRIAALEEIYRVLKPGGYFFFTTHDRDNPKQRKHWKKEEKDWNKGRQHPDYEEFGDRIGGTDWGDMFIHIPRKDETTQALEKVGFRVIKSAHRNDVARESREVKEFSDDCILWMATRPKDEPMRA